MRRLFVCVLALFLLSTALTCFSQQTDIRQFTVFGAFSYLSTPSLNLTQRGFDGDFGYNARPWLTFGFDFSYNNGHSSVLPNYLNSATQAKLAPICRSSKSWGSHRRSLTTLQPIRMRADRNSITAECNT